MISVAVATPDKHHTAVSLLFVDSTDELRQSSTRELLEAAENGVIPLTGLLLAEKDGEPVGAALYVEQQDQTAMVWPPAALSRAAHDAVVNALLEDICCRIDRAGIWLAQSLIEVDRERAGRALLGAGFVHLTDLHYLQRPLDDPLPSHQGERLETITFSPDSNAEYFERVLQATYVDTLDCPEMNGLRTAAQSLAGHRLSGEFDPNLWKIYQSGGRDVGILLLSNHPEYKGWEVAYMGLVSGARGRGMGKQMMLDGLAEAEKSGRDSVFLAVDARNHYARKLYNELGFLEIGERSAYVRCSKLSRVDKK